MKITDVTLTLFAWPGIPSTTYGRHTGRFGGDGQLGLLTLATDAGVEGHAFLGSAMRGAHLDGASLIEVLKPVVLGQDPLDRERLYHALWQRSRSTTARAIGAVDVALWDLAGKVAGLPIHRLLGSYRDRVRAYASSAVLATPEAYGEESARFKAEGWTAYKIHPPTDPATDIAVCQAVRRAVGDGYAVMLDGSWAYDYPTALRVGQAIEALDYHWYEDPLADDDIYSYVKLKQHLRIPILATEYSPGGFTAYAPVAPRAGDGLPPRRRRGQGRDHRLRQGGAPRRGLPHELRGAPRRQLPQQRGEPPRHHGDPELRVLRGAPAGRRPEVRAGRGHRGGRPGPGPRAHRPRAGAHASTST